MLVALAVVIGLPLVVLVTEIQLARRGADVATPEIATLARTLTPSTPSDGVVRILWLGDSTAAGVGATDADGAVSSQVGERLIAAGTQHTLDVVVIAKSGARINDVVDDQLPRVGSVHADVVVISVGANDTVHLTRAGTFRDRYNELLDGLGKHGVAADQVVVVGVPDMGAPRRLLQPLRGIVGARARSLDREAKHVAEKQGAHYVDLFGATSTPFRAHPSTYFAADKYHPSDAGYALWADAIAPAVTAALD
ncbi:MAG: hypothetical protein QOF21_295 [Actinomycetota bacterium]